MSKKEEKIEDDDISIRYLRDKNRTIYLKGDIDQDSAQKIVMDLKYLDNKEENKDITILIDCNGGEISSMYSIIDTMNSLKNDVCTVALGWAASAAAVILSAGTKGKRYAHKHSSILIHHTQMYPFSNPMDIQNHRKWTTYCDKMDEEMFKTLSENTGMTVDFLKQLTLNDCVIIGEEAKKLGVIDHIID